MTDPHEQGEGVAQCIRLALEDARIEKERINYINAHATSTRMGDLCEIEALRSSFGSHSKKIKMNATKSMIGHCLGAAGGLEAVATIMAIQTSRLHPTINLEHPEPILSEFDVVGENARDHCVDVALSNSFGFGGHNSTLVFAPYRGI
jgi:3-oxoacyl-[acyl-carrier-protein] synthase II